MLNPVRSLRVRSVRGARPPDVWQNWARTSSAEPVRWERPRDVAEVAEAIASATADGLTVKAVGAGHSFSDAPVSPGVMLDLSAMDRVRQLDSSTGHVTAEAGIRLHRLSPWLWRAGLALTNVGDIDRQTLGGAIATGTHGTGLRFGSMASQVVQLEIVLADGTVATCSRTSRPDLFAAAAVGIGAFGVVTAVTIQAVPAFPMRASDGPMPLEELFEGIDAFAEEHDHAEFYWFPHTRTAHARVNERLEPGTPLEPRPRWRAAFDDEVMHNGAFDLVCRVAAAAPSRAPAINGFSSRLVGRRQYVDRSYRVFSSSRRVIFREQEFAIPRAAAVDVLREVDRWLERPGNSIGFPIEVRFSAPDDAWLSMAYGRETAWITAQTYHRQEHGRYMKAVSDIAGAVGGRPHWGKLHSLDAAALREVYPCFDEALAVRDVVDPQRLFANAYLDRVLGP